MSELEVAFISGAPRSGTTLLGMILGQLDGVCDAGELWALWRPAFRHGDLCGCGRAVRECDFWLTVAHKALGPDFEQRGAALGELHRRNLGTLRAPRAWSHARGWWRRPAYSEYADALGRQYRAIAEVSGARVVVDSSKMATDALLAATIPGIRVSVIHLVRDPRGVAWSWQKRLRQPGPQGRDIDRHGALASGARWTTYNALAELFLATAPRTRFRALRYEDLLANPGAVTADLAAWLGADPGSSPIVGDPPRVALARPTHPVWGNPVRTTSGDVPLRADEEWRGTLGRAERLVNTAVSLPFLRHYGYPIWGAAGGRRAS